MEEKNTWFFFLSIGGNVFYHWLNGTFVSCNLDTTDGVALKCRYVQ
jgi:hypothetical protein